jgi:predicted RNA-binding protein with PIN domain
MLLLSPQSSSLKVMYLIDGNNVIGQRVGWHRDKPGSRRRLLDDLARLVSVRKLRLAVVFDGAPDDSFPDGAIYRGVKIFYARKGSDADARIIEMVEKEKDRKGLTVVTSDRKLSTQVRLCGVQVMRSGKFRQTLDETFDDASDLDRLSVKDEEIDDWLRYFGVSEEEEEDE